MWRRESADGIPMPADDHAKRTRTSAAPPAQESEAGFRARAMLVCVIVVSVAAAGQIVGALVGFSPGAALLSGCLLGVGAGVLLAGPLVGNAAQGSDTKRRAMITRIQRVAQADREELLDDLLECEQDIALGPLAKAVHDALTRAHADRLEAAALRREMAHKVEREAKKRTVTLEHEAERDELTGLHNRRGFDRGLGEMIEEAKETGEEIVLLAIDMDRFKLLNDTCGHEKGDEALRIAGELIKAHTRDGDLGARVGGDELFIVMRGVDAPTALGVGERLIGLFSNHPAGNGLPCPWPGMSIGLSRLIADGAEDAEDLKRLADEALYESKRNGRGRITLARAA